MDKHPHSTAIDRIGRTAIMSHFNISKQAVSQWTRNGVPSIHRNSIRLLAMYRGVQVPELNEGEKA
jgi:hypothetical protein